MSVKFYKSCDNSHQNTPASEEWADHSKEYPPNEYNRTTDRCCRKSNISIRS